MSHGAAWLLRRYRDGGLPDWSMREVLQHELNRLVSDHSALRPEMDELRRVTPERLTGFDTASDRALQRLGEGRFDLALREIQAAERDLAELRLCLTVAVDWRRTSVALAGLEDMLSPELMAQATVRVLQRLRHLARALLDQGEARKARFVALLLADQVDRLRARRSGDLKAGFERMLGELESQAGLAVDHIRKLSQEGYHHLVERLAEDLMVELSVTDRARRAFTTGGSLGAIENDLAAVRRQAQTVQAALSQWLENGSYS